MFREQEETGKPCFFCPGLILQIITKRKTAESEVIVKVDFGPRYANPKKGLQTSMPFLNHMLEHVIWRGEFNLEVTVELQDFDLKHVICEDIGITFGRALKEHVESKINEGLKGYGSAVSTIDEALAEAVVSFENRAYLDFNAKNITIPAWTEGTNSEDLQTFFEGFVQGACCTLHLNILKGENGHHLWEATFRAFGEALFRALELSPWRRGMTAGVAGVIEMQVEKDS